MLSESHSSIEYSRPAGNKDLGYADYHDVDPDGNVWNK